MGKIFRKYIRNFMRWALRSDGDAPQPEEVTSYQGHGISNMKVRSGGIGDGNNGMNFTVYGAIGGKVIQFTTYDPVRDKGYSCLYIVTDKEDLGEEIGQIITKESLSR
jgi:hypothetical protein